jgi:hypothetical protein
VGRELDLAALREAIDRACVGEGGAALVTGEPGIGKSRLLEEATRDCAGRGLAVLWGRASEAGGAPAFWPWLQVLRSSADLVTGSDIDSGDPDDVGLLARLVPVLGTGSRPDAVLVQDDEGTRFRLFDAVCRFLLRRAERQPTVVVIEDLQWADESTLLLVEHLTPLLPGSRLLLAVTCREVHVDRHDRLSTTLAELTRTAAATVRLLGLDVPEVAELIRSISGGRAGRGRRRPHRGPHQRQPVLRGGDRPAPRRSGPAHHHRSGPQPPPLAERHPVRHPRHRRADRPGDRPDAGGRGQRGRHRGGGGRAGRGRGGQHRRLARPLPALRPRPGAGGPGRGPAAAPAP